jgi:metal-responsive CopG/Arc/MetJ family transcriptional regulator
MQVSIYLDSQLVKKIDQRAKRAKKNRSRLIQFILEKEIGGKKPKSVFDEVFGVLEASSAKKMVKTLRASRKNSSRFR